MRLLVAGSRGFYDYRVFSEIMERAVLMMGFEPTSIVHGDEPTGVDHLGKRWGKERGLQVVPFSADWRRFPKTGGFIRNVHMAGRVDGGVVVMLRGGTPGSRHMIKQMVARDLPLWIEEVDAPAHVTGWMKKPPEGGSLSSTG